MRRLTTMVGENTFIKKVIDESCESVCLNEYDCRDCPIQEAFEKLAHYEDLEEQGRLIEVVKCKDCSCFEEITAAYNYYFCNRYGGIVTENDYCSRAEAKLEELNPLPISYGDHGALSKEEAMERLRVKDGIE